MLHKEVHFNIQGRVQGGGFRYSLAQKARALNVTGWCENKQDGTVECVAQGEEDALHTLVKWCRKGPLFAKVKELIVEWRKQGDPHQSFEIK